MGDEVGDEVSRWVGRRLANGGLSGPFRRLEVRLAGAGSRSKASRRSWRALVVPDPSRPGTERREWVGGRSRYRLSSPAA